MQKCFVIRHIKQKQILSYKKFLFTLRVTILNIIHFIHVCDPFCFLFIFESANENKYVRTKSCKPEFCQYPTKGRGNIRVIWGILGAYGDYLTHVAKILVILYVFEITLLTICRVRLYRKLALTSLF